MVLLEEIFPIFNFSTCNSIIFDVIKLANLILSHVECFNAPGDLLQVPLGWILLRGNYKCFLWTLPFQNLKPSNVSGIV